MDLRALASAFGLILVAELPDKTALAAMLLAARRREHALAVFLGAGAAFTVHAALATAFGRAVSLLPERWVHLGSGLLFLGFAIDLWLRAPEEEAKAAEAAAGKAASFRGTAAGAFLVVFVAEWGDLTQLAIATVAAHARSPASVFLGSALGLWTAAGLAVSAGSRLLARVEPRTLQRAAAVVFALFGLLILSR